MGNRYFFLGMLACQIGQMVFFEFCFSKPSKLPFWNAKRQFILVDNRNLLFNFLFFLLKTSLAISFFLFADMLDLLKVNGIVFWILILSIITIHLQAWQTISRTFYKANYWVVYSFLSMLLTTSLLIQFHPIDYKKTNQAQLNKIPDYQLKIKLPASPYPIYNEAYGYWHIPVTVQQKDENIILMIDKDTISFEQIPSKIEFAKKHLIPYKHPLLFASLTIDKDVKMDAILKLKYQFRTAEITRFSYTIALQKKPFKNYYPFDRQHSFMDKTRLICPESALKKSLSFLKRTKTTDIFQYDIGCHPYSFLWEAIGLDLQEKTVVELKGNGDIMVDNTPIKHPELIAFFEQKTPKHILLLIDGKAKYQDYIHLKTALWQTQINIWNSVCLQKYGRNYSLDLPLAHRKAITTQNRFIVIEPNSETEIKIYQELERIINN